MRRVMRVVRGVEMGLVVLLMIGMYRLHDRLGVVETLVPTVWVADNDMLGSHRKLKDEIEDDDYVSVGGDKWLRGDLWKEQRDAE